MSILPQAPDLSPDDYCVLGLATCFMKVEGEVVELQIVEPIASASLETLVKGIPTSYQLACAKSLGEIMIKQQPSIPKEFPESVQLCSDFTERLIAAARTYQKSPQAKELLPQGTLYKDFNYSVEKKRVLNAVKVVRNEDNIKQHPNTHKVL